jgi:hypothetical protein
VTLLQIGGNSAILPLVCNSVFRRSGKNAPPSHPRLADPAEASYMEIERHLMPIGLPMLLSPKELGRAELLNLDFEDEKNGITLDMAANTISWLISIYSVQYSANLALAVSRRLSDTHFIGIEDNVTIRHAFVADQPQTDVHALSGNALSILGSHPLTDTVAESLVNRPDHTVRIGTVGSHIQFNPGEEARLVELAEELPWFRAALKMKARPVSGERVIDLCIGLGMPRVLLNMAD